MKNHVPNDFLQISGQISVELRSIAGAFTCAASDLAAGAGGAASQPAFDPRQTEKRFDDWQSGETPARPRLPMPNLARPNVGADTRPLFELHHVTIVGARAIPPDPLAAAYQPYIGKKVSQADLAAIAAAISETYRAAGFHLSRAIVPPQDIEGGQVRVEMIEGGIAEVVLKGEGAEEFGVRPMLDPVLAEQPARLATLERQLLLINGRPGVRIEDTKPGGDRTCERPVPPDRDPEDLAPLRLARPRQSRLVRGRPVAELCGGGVQLVHDPGRYAGGQSVDHARRSAPARLRRISYDVPVGTDGLRVGASGLYSEVWPGDYRHAFSDNTRTEAFELRGSILPLQSQRSTLTLTASTVFSNVSESDVFGPIYNDRIRTVNLTSDYRLQDDFGGTNYFTMTWRQGLDIMGASQRGDDFLSRDGASGKFSALNYWFTRYQTITDAWSLKIAGAGQTASGPLFLSQQFYLGGLAFGRGYGAAEISGDNGMAGSLELRFDQKANLGYLSGYQLYGFVDSGVAWNDGFRYTDGIALTSAGAGVRFFFGPDLQADLGVAAPLSYRAPDNPARDVRVLFSFSSALKLCPSRAATRCL